MINLSEPNISYLLISPQKVSNTPHENLLNYNRLQNILWAKNWTLIPVMGYYKQEYEKSFICICPYDNNNLRAEAIFLMDEFGQESVILKYAGDTNPYHIFNDGREKPLSLTIYDNNLENKTYLYNGVSFSFQERKRYYFPKKRQEIKDGMLVEYFNNNKWIPRKVSNIETEWDKFYKLLVKYEKVRIESIF